MCNHILYLKDSEMVDQTKLCIGAIIQPLANLKVDEEPINLIPTPAEG